MISIVLIYFDIFYKKFIYLKFSKSVTSQTFVQINYIVYVGSLTQKVFHTARIDECVWIFFSDF